MDTRYPLFRMHAHAKPLRFGSSCRSGKVGTLKNWGLPCWLTKNTNEHCIYKNLELGPSLLNPGNIRRPHAHVFYDNLQRAQGLSLRERGNNEEISWPNVEDNFYGTILMLAHHVAVDRLFF